MFGEGEPDRTVLTLPLSFTTSSTTSGEVSDEAHDTFERVVEFCDIPRTKKEIQEYLQIKRIQEQLSTVVDTLFTAIHSLVGSHFT